MVLSFYRAYRGGQNEQSRLHFSSHLCWLRYCNFPSKPTGRGIKAIEISKECLIFLNHEVLRKEEGQFVDLVTIAIYEIIFIAYCFIPDYTNAIRHGNQLLDIYHELAKTGEDEGILLLTLAMIYEKRFKYAEAEKLSSHVFISW